MKTAKEILIEESKKDPNFGMLTGTMPVILAAMEVYAKEKCISFIQHLSKKEYDFSMGGGRLNKDAAEEFYNEFLKEE